MVHRLVPILLMLAVSASVSAADEEDSRSQSALANNPPIGACTQDCEAVASFRVISPRSSSGVLEGSRDQRPRILVPLYASLLALEAFDAALTIRGLQNGAAEANPAMSGVVGSPAAFVALKMGAATASIVAVERLRKRHPKAAAALIVLMDPVMATVVANNVRFSAPTSR